MQTILESNTLRVELDHETQELCLTAKGRRSLTLRSKDTIGGQAWFNAPVQVTSSRNGQTNCARFDVTSGNDRAQYAFSWKDDVPVLMVACQVFPDESAAPERAMSWLRFHPCNAQSVHTFEPEWGAAVDELPIRISFRRELVLETADGCVGLFHGGEPYFDLKTAELCPDMWVETCGLTGFHPTLTSVLAFGESVADIRALRAAADELFQEAAPQVARSTKHEDGQKHSFRHGGISFEITTCESGAALTRMSSIGREQELFAPLSQLTLMRLSDRKEFTADTLSGWSHVRLYKENRGGRLILSGLGELTELSLEIEFHFVGEERIEWQTHVINAQHDLSVLSASYPPSFWDAENAACFIPEHCGWVEENVAAVHFYRDGIYPRGWRFTMGYFAAYLPAELGGAGFYCALHDPDGSFRTMNIETDALSKTGLFFMRSHAPGRGKEANAFSLPGRLVWQSFCGDWYDATLIYRDFVRDRAEWLPAVGPEGREDTPLWAKELPVWIMDWMSNTNPLAEPVPTSIHKEGDLPMEYWYTEPLRLKEQLGVPIGYHVYNWHWIPFNNDYPHYLPAKKEFCENVQTLRDAGVRIMPYINARLWDTLDHEDQDWQFSSRARAWATKDASGKLFTEKYESHEPDGSLCELAAMCPSSGVWKEQMANVLDGLFHTIGVDGVYMDQIAAAAPYLCEDPAHNHLPGGGSWWTQQYNLLVRRSRQVRGEDGILTTEDNAEVYMKAMDGFLSWIWTFDNLVPAFSVLYSGYVMMFGRTTNGIKKGDEIFLRYETAEQFVFGGQLGWLNADVSRRPAEVRFLRMLSQMRYRYAPFFYKGEALRPAALTTDRPVQLTMPAYYDSRLFEARQVLTGTWRLWDGSRTVMFLVNCDKETAHFTAQTKGTHASVTDGNGSLLRVQSVDGDLLLEGEIAPESCLVIDL